MTKQAIFNGSRAVESRTWHEVLEATNIPEQVLVVARDYLATWEPNELDALPTECRPPDYFHTPDEIVNYAFVVVQHQCGPDKAEPLIARMANFFSHAARQVALLMSHTRSPQARNESSI
jgi:hypothetical protein